MYIPDHFREDNIEVAYDLIDQNGFAIMMSPHASGDDTQPFITHLPVIRTGDMLYGHVARANKHWKRFCDGHQVTLIFQAAHGYISPRWFISKDLVPTWAYSTVHIRSTPEILTDASEARGVIEALSAQYEGPEGWSPSEVSESKLEAMSRGIVCFKMPIEHLECKRKLNQNKSMEDQRAVV